MDFIILGLVTLLLLLISIKLSLQKYTPGGVPIVGNIPFLGCGLSMRSRGPLFLDEMHKKHGDVYTLYMGGRYLTMVFDEQFLPYFYKSPDTLMNLKENVIEMMLSRIIDVPRETAEEKKEEFSFHTIKNFLHKNQNHFVEGALVPHVEHVIDIATALQNHDPQGRQFTVELFTFMLHIVGGLGLCTMAGAAVGLQQNIIVELANWQLAALVVLTQTPTISKIFPRATNECRRARTVVRTAISDALANGTLSEFGREIVEHQYVSTNRKTSADEMTVLIFMYVFGILANSQSTATDTLVEILADSRIKSKVMEELNDVIMNDESNKNVSDGKYNITHEMVNRLEYLEHCVHETLRIHAPPIHVRRTEKDLVINDGKAKIPKGTIMAVSPWLRHRSEKLYEKPLEYIPERFEKPCKTKFSFLTFGQGRHYCLGRKLGEFMVKMIIATLLLKYDVEMPKDEFSTKCKEPKIRWISFGVVRPNVPVMVNFTRKF